MDISLRPVAPEDGKALAEFNAVAFARNPEFDPAINPDWTTSDAALDYFSGIAAGSNHCMLAVNDSGEIVGYISTEPASHGHRLGTYLEISNVGVHPDHRRSGIATTLMNHAEQWARANGYTRLELTCYSRNASALAFYEDMGFESVHVIMEKDLAT